MIYSASCLNSHSCFAGSEQQTRRYATLSGQDWPEHLALGDDGFELCELRERAEHAHEILLMSPISVNDGPTTMPNFTA
jgi:hypothetical protein